MWLAPFINKGYVETNVIIRPYLGKIMYPPLIHRGGSLDEGTENYKAEHICDKAQIKKNVY